MYFLTLRKMRNSMFTRRTAEAGQDEANDNEAERPSGEETDEDREDQKSAAVVSLCSARQARRCLPRREPGSAVVGR